MALYRLIGGPFEVVDAKPVIKGEQIGQALDLDPAVAEHLIMHGAALLPEDNAAQIFTAEDWKKYDSPAKLAQAGSDFQDQLHAARIAHHEFKSGLIAAAQKES